MPRANPRYFRGIRGPSAGESRDARRPVPAHPRGSAATSRFWIAGSTEPERTRLRSHTSRGQTRHASLRLRAANP
jgi:hypothetical protein